MTNAIKTGALILVLLFTATAAKADEPPRMPPPRGEEPPRRPPARTSENDSLLRRAHQTKNRHILQFIREQERKEGRQGLRDPDFRAQLEAKLELLESGDIVERHTEARYCRSCEQSRAQFNENEVLRLKALLARLEQPSPFSMQMSMNPTPMNQGQFGYPGFGGNFFNTSGFTQMLGSIMNGGQQLQGYGNFGYGNISYGNNMFAYARPNYSYGNQFRFNQAPAIAGLGSYGYGYNQAPAIAGPAISNGYNYGYSQAPAIAGSAYSYSLTNGAYRSSAPAVLSYR